MDINHHTADASSPVQPFLMMIRIPLLIITILCGIKGFFLVSKPFIDWILVVLAIIGTILNIYLTIKKIVDPGEDNKK